MCAYSLGVKSAPSLFDLTKKNMNSEKASSTPGHDEEEIDRVMEDEQMKGRGTVAGGGDTVSIEDGGKKSPAGEWSCRHVPLIGYL